MSFDSYCENLLKEMALKSYNTIGFDKDKDGKMKSHSFRDKTDRDLVTHPVNIQKSLDFFKDSIVDFDFFFVNKPGILKYAERGIVKWEFIRDKLRLTEKELNDLKIDTDNITVFFVGNNAAEKTHMTPWTMAHRIGHAIKRNQQWDQYYKWLRKELDDILRLYGIRVPDLYYGSYSKTYEMARRYLYNAIGTMRSARLNLIKRPDEFFYEVFAQHLNSGAVKMNRLPEKLALGVGGWGRKDYRHTKQLEEVNDIVENIENTVGYYLDDVLRSVCGSFIVM